MSASTIGHIRWVRLNASGQFVDYTVPVKDADVVVPKRPHPLTLTGKPKPFKVTA